VGIEIRTDAIFAAVLDLSGRTIASSRRSLRTRTLNGVTNAVVAAKANIVSKGKIAPDKVLGAGIVMPGPFGRTGLSGTESEFSIFHGVSPSVWFEEALNVPVVVENDANAAAVAERVTGVTKGLDTYAFLYFGSGLGLGIVQGGRLVTGAFGNAGEIGHIPIRVDTRTVSLEDVLSRMAVQNHLANEGYTLDTIDSLAEAFDSGLSPLMDWISKAAAPFADAIAIIENMLDPQTVIIGGAMPDNILDNLIDNADLTHRSVSNRPGRHTPRIIRGASGRLTGTLGAASLAINRAFTPQIADAN
jgi:predicted NBD/HSP70 family sugar kinase